MFFTRRTIAKRGWSSTQEKKTTVGVGDTIHTGLDFSAAEDMISLQDGGFLVIHQRANCSSWHHVCSCCWLERQKWGQLGQEHLNHCNDSNRALEPLPRSRTRSARSPLGTPDLGSAEGVSQTEEGYILITLLSSELSSFPMPFTRKNEKLLYKNYLIQLSRTLSVAGLKQKEVFLIHWTSWAKGNKQDLGDPGSGFQGFGLQSSTRGGLR